MTDIAMVSLIYDIRKSVESQTHRNSVEEELPGAGGWGKQGEVGKKGANDQL